MTIRGALTLRKRTSTLTSWEFCRATISTSATRIPTPQPRQFVWPCGPWSLRSISEAIDSSLVAPTGGGAGSCIARPDA